MPGSPKITTLFHSGVQTMGFERYALVGDYHAIGPPNAVRATVWAAIRPLWMTH